MSSRSPARTMLIFMLLDWVTLARGFHIACLGRARTLSSLRPQSCPVLNPRASPEKMEHGLVLRTIPDPSLSILMSGSKEKDERGAEWRENTDVALLSSRRFLLQIIASGVAAELLLKQRATATSPRGVQEVDTQSVYDLGLNDYNKAPNKKLVVADGTIEQSPADRRKYRAFTLANGLRVLVASDPTTDEAAAALNVHVGHFSDPAYLPGLAHFCEHMLFLGTSKYPSEGELDSFLAKNGGSSNAYTSAEETCYFFSVNQEALMPALDRFSQFFISPLFTSAATDRELNAIESEHSKNIQQDSWRIDQVLKLRANPQHPASKFGTGNLFTLKDALPAGIDTRRELLQFYNSYYSANQMTLAIVGRDSLDTLEKWATDLFSAVGNTDAPPPEAAWAGKVAAYSSESAEEEVLVVPIQDLRTLELSWVLPFTSAQDKRARLLNKPHVIVDALIGHEGKGSVLSYLKAEGYATAVDAEVADTTADYEVLSISIGLTPAGLASKDTVIACILEYIDMANSQGVPDYILQEVERMSAISWTYRENSEAGEIVPGLAATMHLYAPEYYLSGPARVRNLDKTAVQGLFGALTADKMLVTLVSQTLKDKAQKKEKWYGTAYALEQVSDEARRKWSSAPQELKAALSLPRPNACIPRDLSLKAPPSEALSSYPPGPALIYDARLWRVHYMQDRRYGQPKAYAFFNLKQPNSLFGLSSTPRLSAIARLYKSSLEDAVNEYVYEAALGGLGFSLEFTPKATRLTFAGYNDRLAAFVDTVAQTVAAHRPSDNLKIARYKDQISRELKAFDNQQPYQQAAAYASVYTSAPAFFPTAVLRELEFVTLEEVVAFGDMLWRECAGEVLVQGNVRAEEAGAMVQSMQRALNFTALNAGQEAQTRFYKVPLSPSSFGSVIRSNTTNPKDVNSAVIVAFQHADVELRQQMAMEVLASMLQQPFYAELRTNQQLGYIVAAGVRAQNDVRSLTLTVQSSLRDAIYLTDKVFEFVKGFEGELERMEEEQVQSFVAAVVEQKMQKITRLSDETERNWGEILAGTYQYDRNLQEAQATKELNKEMLVKVWKRVVAEGGSDRRVLTSQVMTQANAQTLASFAPPLPQGSVLLLDPEQLRTTAEVILPPKAVAPPLSLRGLKL